MKRRWFLNLIFICILAKAQTYPCPDISFNGGVVCNNPDCIGISTKSFGTDISSFDFPVEGSVSIALNMDIYYPKQTKGLRPFILLLHGGGLRKGCRNNMKDECKEFAKRGFVAATADYRLGYVPHIPNPLICGSVIDSGDDNNDPFDEVCQLKNNCDECKSGVTKSQQDSALYRGIQDAHAALRYIMHYIINPNPNGGDSINEFNIDPNNIYVGGSSAGARIALSLAYMQQRDWDNFYPNFKTYLRRINKTGNSFTDDFKIRGVFNDWGVIPNTNYIEDKLVDRVPAISFHGQCDLVHPYTCGYIYGCSSLDQVCGSKAIYDKLGTFAVPISRSLYSAPFGKHGILQCNSGLEQRVKCTVNFFRNNFYTKNIIANLNENVNNECGEISCSSMRSSYAIFDVQPAYLPLEKLRVYPNPTKNVVICSYNLQKRSKIEIQIVNRMSQIIYRIVQLKQAGNYNDKLPVNLKPGIYFIILKSNEGVYTEKLTVVK